MINKGNFMYTRQLGSHLKAVAKLAKFFLSSLRLAGELFVVGRFCLNLFRRSFFSFLYFLSFFSFIHLLRLSRLDNSNNEKEVKHVCILTCDNISSFFNFHSEISACLSCLFLYQLLLLFFLVSYFELFVGLFPTI